MGLDGGRSIGMPKSSSEGSSKSEFSDSEFLFGGVKFNGGIDMGYRDGERDGDLGGDSNLGGGEGSLGVVESGIWGEMGIWLVETVMWRVVERGMWGGGDLCLFCQAWRVVGESGGGIGIAGEPRGCGEGDVGGGDLCLFCQARRVVGESGGGIGITGEPARCSVSVFFS